MNDSGRSDTLGRHGFQLALSILLAIPFLANTVAQFLGFVVFFLADSETQFVWGTLALLNGLRAIAGLRRSAPAVRLSLGLAAAAGCLLYAESVYRTFRSGPRGATYGVESALMVFLSLGRLMEARRSRRDINPGGR